MVVEYVQVLFFLYLLMYLLLFDSSKISQHLISLYHHYSCVEIAHVAKLINLPEQQVVHKLSQMVLDHKLAGILDQGKGHLIMYNVSVEDTSFSKGLEIIANMSVAVETLSGRAEAVMKVSA